MSLKCLSIKLPPSTVAGVRRLVTLSAVSLCIGLVGLAVLASTPATNVATAAPDGCWGDGPWFDPDDWHDAPSRDPERFTGPTKFCHAYRGGPLVPSVVPCPGRDLDHFSCWNTFNPPHESGYLYAGDSWFVCQRQAPRENPPVGSARNTWWLATIGDEAYGLYDGFGYFPATHVSGGDNYEPIPGLPECPKDPPPSAPGEIGSGIDDDYPIDAFRRAGTRLTPKTGVRFRLRLARRASVTVRTHRVRSGPAAKARRWHRVRLRAKDGWNRVEIDRLGRRRLHSGRYAVRVAARAQRLRSRTVKRTLRVH